MRKRVMGILLLLIVTGTLVGCNELNETAEEEQTTGIFEELNRQVKEQYNTIAPTDSRHVYDYVDPETGVHYLIYAARSGDGGQGGGESEVAG